MDPTIRRYGFNHTICENCWFRRSPGRFPVQLVRQPGDNRVDTCCLCGSYKVTQIWVRIAPDADELVCEPGIHDED